MMKVYKAVHERENKCKELHKEMNMNVGPTRLVQPDFYLFSHAGAGRMFRRMVQMGTWRKCNRRAE